MTDCNCQQSERLKKELKQTKSERDNAEETWDKERKMYQAVCVERDDARAESEKRGTIIDDLIERYDIASDEIEDKERSRYNAQVHIGFLEQQLEERRCCPNCAWWERNATKMGSCEKKSESVNDWLPCGGWEMLERECDEY